MHNAKYFILDWVTKFRKLFKPGYPGGFMYFSKKEKEWLALSAINDVDTVRKEFSYQYEAVLMHRVKKKIERMREELEWVDSLDVELNHPRM